MQMRPWTLAALCFLVIACSIAQLDEERSAPPGSAESSFEDFWLKAEDDDPEARALIGYMLYFGEGVSRDTASAQYWFERAARQEHAGALLNLEIIYHTGVGSRRNPDAALRYYERWRTASDQG